MNRPADSFVITLTPAAWGYIRQVLGTRPHDEVGQLIRELEAVVAQQQNAQAPPPTLGNPLKGNGSAEADQHAGDPAP